MSETQAKEQLFERRYDLDWLRIIAILLIFFYHCTKFFDTDAGWFIKNNEINRYLDKAMSFGASFALPLFFVIAGMGTFYALKFVSAGKYVLSRTIRLLVPFIIGLFTHVPLQVFLTRKQQGYSGNFFQFYGQMFNGIYIDNTSTGDFAVFGSHLWFLVILFLYSLILLGPFVLLRKENNHNRLLKVTSFLAKPGLIFTFVIPIILCELLNYFLGGILPSIGGYSFYTYLVFYFIGYIIASDKKFKESIEKQIIPALVVVILAAVSHGTLVFLNFPIFASAGYHPYKILDWIFYSILGWSLVILLIGLGSKYLNVNNKARKFLNELVLPFYILHQTVIIVIGYYMVQLSYSIFTKYVIIVVSSLPIILVLLAIIKYINPLRFMFGMRWKKGLLRNLKKEKVTNLEN